MCILRLSVLCTIMISSQLDPKKSNLFVLASTSLTASTLSSTNNPTAILPSTNDPTATLPSTNDPTATLSSTNDSTATISNTNDPTATLSSTKDPTATTLSITNDPTASLSSTNDTTATLSSTNDRNATLSSTNDHTATLSNTNDPTGTLSSTNDPTAPLSSTNDPTATLSSTNDPTAILSSTDITTTLLSTNDPTAPLSSTDITTTLPNTNNPTATLSSTDTTTTLLSTNDPTATLLSTNDPTAPLSSTDTTTTLLSTNDPTATLSSTNDPTATLSSTNDPTATLSSTNDPTAILSSTNDPTATLSSTNDPTATLSSTNDPTATLSSTNDPTATLSSTNDTTSTVSSTSDTTPTYNSIDTSLSEKHSTSSNTSDDTSTVPNTSDDTSIGPDTSDTSTGPDTRDNSSSDSITSKATSTVLTSTSTATVLTSTATPTTTTALNLTRSPVANLPFRMKFNNSLYNDSLKDNNSPYYKQVCDNYTTQLTNAWRNGTPGFEDVVIKSFRLGSLIVDYIVIIKVNKDNMTELLDNLNFTVLPHLEALEDADKDYLKSRFESDIEDAKFQVVDAQKDLCNLNNCPEGWQCQEILNSLVLCTSPCANKSCNNGICSWDIDKKAICSCKKDDHYIYGGDDCSEKAEKLTMESETIIAIAAGVGGGLILILLVVLIVTCCRRKSPKDKMGESSQMSMLPMTEIGDDNAALITRDMSLTTDLATSRLYRDTKTAPSNLRDVVPVAELGSFEEDGRSRSGREMRYGDDGRLYHSIPENQIYGAASAGLGYTNKALEGDNDQAVAYFYQPEKLNRFGMESSDVNRKRQDEMARYSSAPTRDDRSHYISDSAPKREIEPDYFDWSNGAPRTSQEPRFTHTNLDKANAGDPRGHYKSGVDPRTHQQPSSRPYSPDSSAPSYYNDPPQRSNVYDYILAEKPVAIRRPTLMPQKR